MNKIFYSFGNPLKVKFRKHYCYKCGRELSILKDSKIVSPKSEEARYYDFNIGSDGVMFGPCEFSHNVFYCPTCSEQIEFVTQLSLEDIDIFIEKTRKKFFKKNINLEIKKAYETEKGNHLRAESLENVPYLCLTVYHADKEVFVYKIPRKRKNCWERPYYFETPTKEFVKSIKKHL